MSERRAIVEDLVTARSMAIATLPVDEHEPSARSMLWVAGLSRLLASMLVFARRGDLHELRDLVILAGGHIVGWIEAIDDELGHAPP